MSGDATYYSVLLHISDWYIVCKTPTSGAAWTLQDMDEDASMSSGQGAETLKTEYTAAHASLQ